MSERRAYDSNMQPANPCFSKISSAIFSLFFLGLRAASVTKILQSGMFLMPMRVLKVYSQSLWKSSQLVTLPSVIGY